MQIRPKKVVLFPEIARVKNVLSLTRPHIQITIRIYVFNLKNTKPEIIKRQKAKEFKEERRIHLKNLTGYDIVCEFTLCTLTYRAVNFS